MPDARKAYVNDKYGKCNHFDIFLRTTITTICKNTQMATQESGNEGIIYRIHVSDVITVATLTYAHISVETTPTAPVY